MSLKLRGDEFYLYEAVVRRIVDGDTIDVIVDLGFGVYTNQRLRFARINAPETRGKTKQEGVLAAEELKMKLAIGMTVVIKTSKRGKYGRYLAEIYHSVSGENINDWMVENGYATYTVA